MTVYMDLSGLSELDLQVPDGFLTSVILKQSPLSVPPVAATKAGSARSRFSELFTDKLERDLYLSALELTFNDWVKHHNSFEHV